MKYGFGVDLGGTTVKIAFFEESGKMVSKWEIPTVTTNGGSQILPDIAASIREYLEQNSVAQTDLRRSRPRQLQGYREPLRQPGLGRV